MSSYLIKKWWTVVQFGFRLLYYEFAWSYDLVSWTVSLGQWSRWRQSSYPFLYGKQILELGHGPGHTLLDLSAQGFSMTGVDLSPYMGRQAKRKLQKAKLPVTIVRAKAQQLPFANEQFDSVLATFPTPYIIDPRTLQETYRLLKTNGRLLILIEGHFTYSGFLPRIINLLYQLTGQKPTTTDTPPENPWHLFHQRLLDAGFAAHTEIITLPNSSCSLIIGQK